jgi:hypothetical protein
MPKSVDEYQNLLATLQKIFGQDKKYLFGTIGFLGGILGALVAELAIGSGGSYVLQVLIVALWAGLFSGFISVALHLAVQIYNRKVSGLEIFLWRAFPLGFAAGAVSGGIAQAIFGLNLYYTLIFAFIFRAVCWGICGAILGAILSYAITNLGLRRAVIAGGAGGFIGGLGFQFIALLLPEMLGRLAGVGILGMSLGLSLVIIEERSRSAYLEVHWAPNEISTFTLGSIPIYLGGGEDDVYLSGIPHHAMSLVYSDGKVNGIYYVTGDRKELADGHRIRLGKVEIFVRIQHK